MVVAEESHESDSKPNDSKDKHQKKVTVEREDERGEEREEERGDETRESRERERRGKPQIKAKSHDGDDKDSRGLVKRQISQQIQRAWNRCQT
jgi:hypothetical protein